MSGCGGFEWGEFPGIDGPVLLCGIHGRPATGPVYDDPQQRGICQAEACPRCGSDHSGPQVCDDEVVQYVIHPVLRPALDAWLRGRGLHPAPTPSGPDDLRTFTVVPD